MRSAGGEGRSKASFGRAGEKAEVGREERDRQASRPPERDRTARVASAASGLHATTRRSRSFDGREQWMDGAGGGKGAHLSSRVPAGGGRAAAAPGGLVERPCGKVWVGREEGVDLLVGELFGDVDRRTAAAERGQERRGRVRVGQGGGVAAGRRRRRCRRLGRRRALLLLSVRHERKEKGGKGRKEVLADEECRPMRYWKRVVRPRVCSKGQRIGSDMLVARRDGGDHRWIEKGQVGPWTRIGL